MQVFREVRAEGRNKQDPCPVVVRAGLIWVSLARTPSAFPDLPVELEDARFDHFWWPLKTARANILDAVENFLDPAHSYFLHAGLVRKRGAKSTMRVDVKQDQQGCTVRFEERKDTTTWISRLYEQDRTCSVGRYIAPCICQNAFENSSGLTISVTVVFSPVDHGQSRPFAHFTTRKGRIPRWMKNAILKAFHRPILNQDIRMLAWQTETLDQFGGPDYTNAALDLFGPSIWRLANGKTQAEESHTFELTF